MIPFEIEKWRFARKLYPGKGKETARHKLNAEINNSPSLLMALELAGYNRSRKVLRRAELQIIMDEWCLSEDIFD